jgi:L-threonylcarbamoyladenylate synthase
MIEAASTKNISAAAQLLRQGELVAFPTETVYGLGANALSAEAVRKIYEAKGRPSTSPLIVHVVGVDMARELVTEWPAAAQALAERFWPGPLTLVLPKAASIPDALSAGLATVGLRWPKHPVAEALIREAGLPLAAPSANRFTELSPTTAKHVEAGLGDRVAMVLDGGASEVGIESTVLSLAGGAPRLLRPGMISQREIEAVIGPVEVVTSSSGAAHEAPGQHEKHYAPKTRLIVVKGEEDLPPKGHGLYLFRTKASPQIPARRMPKDPEDYASLLYELLHELDLQGLQWIAVEAPPPGVGWDGIRDRLRRASSRSVK